VLRARIAVQAGTASLIGCLVAVVCCAVAVLGSQRALIGGLAAVLRGTLALFGSRHRNVGPAESGRFIVLLASLVATGHREIARFGCLISCQRGEIAGLGDLVSQFGAVQTRMGGLITLIVGLIALIAGQPALRLASAQVAAHSASPRQGAAVKHLLDDLR
jgi:hypothetical protein